MIPELRERFNAQYTEAKYARFLAALEEEVQTKIEFRPCETPVFLSPSLVADLVAASQSIIAQLHTPEYREASRRAIPAAYDAPHEGERPHFIQVDFALVEQPDGRIAPRLIELQGCASLYAFQFILPHIYRRFFELEGLDYLLDGLSDEQYLALLRQIVLQGHDPEEVILMEIDPLSQKTLPDFNATKKLLDVSHVCITDVIKRGRKLYYRRDGREIQIKRIYNRVIIDELVRKGIKSSFDFRDELDVEWAGHTNWYFRWSKFSLPYLTHPTVPRAWFVDRMPEIPADLGNFVLKPLFSFAGIGVKVDVTPEDLAAIPAAERSEYLLQEKVAYAPIIKTLDEPSKVEVRVMFLWPEGAANPIPVTTLTRLSKGLMMGVDFNKNKTWVGSSCGFFPR